MTTEQQLRNENLFLRSEIERLKNRGAGRPKKFNAYQISNIKNAHKQGKSYSEIAKTYKCSKSLICKVINS